MVTLKDIARKVHRSVTTVSRALAGYNDVSPDTIELVRRTAEEMGYEPNILAQRLQKRSTDTIGIVVPLSSQGYSEPFFSEFLAGIGKRAALHNHDLLVAYAHDDTEIATYRKLVTGRRVDGFILFRTLRSDPRAEFLSSIDFPFSAFGRIQDKTDFPCIDEDGEFAMGLIAEHLVQRGHKRIACIGPPERIMFSDVRLKSIQTHLTRLGVGLDPELIRIGYFSQEAGYQQTMQLLDLPNPPTAIIGFNDLVAFGAINAGKDRGLQIGRDLAVTGFDDVPMAANYRPPLTTIHQPIQKIGGMTVELLFDRIGKEADLAEAFRQFDLENESTLGGSNPNHDKWGSRPKYDKVGSSPNYDKPSGTSQNMPAGTARDSSGDAPGELYISSNSPLRAAEPENEGTEKTGKNRKHKGYHQLLLRPQLIIREST